MRVRAHIEPRASWRDRFVEIARQVEGSAAPRAIVAAGLRLKLRTSAFAAQGRARAA